MPKTRKQTQVDMLAADIADAIQRGEFPPGTHLKEQMLAERFGVSRTPVREAIRQLTSTHFIEVRPRRGAIVAETTENQLEVMFCAMAEIEATCARLSALTMSQLERRRLQAAHEAAAIHVSAGNVEEYVSANQTFHNLIYAGSSNPILQNFAVALRRRLAPFRRAQFRAPARLAQSHQEHEAVVRAILAADAAAAHASMLSHVSLVEYAFEHLGDSGGGPIAETRVDSFSIGVNARTS